MHSQLRIDIKQNVNVVGHDLALKQETVRFLANLTDNLLEPLINASNQDRASVFRAKNHVVLARKNNAPIRSIIHHGLDRYHRYNSQVDRAFLPMPKGRGFRARFADLSS